ncbi:MAG: hypothetical protein HYY96_12600 [Candidatus Tectomicrobia bacterium]|nr:hypothetical protein [Candidatus Tectomicrobia bacterium]
MANPPGTLNQLVDLLRQYRLSAVAMAACELDLFSALEDPEQSIEGLAARCGASALGMELLLNACAALGLVHCGAREGGRRYSNSALAQVYLVRSSPRFIGSAAMRQYHVLYQTWGRLAEALRTQRPVQPYGREGLASMSDEEVRAYVLGLYERGRDGARAFARRLDLCDRRHLLDVGAGAGTYSFELLERSPHLHATLFELPRVLRFTRELLGGVSIAPRVRLREGDYHEDDLGSGYDCALLSNILQTESETSCQALLRKVFASLEPGGLLIVNGIMHDATSPAELEQALFSLSMLLYFPEGRAHAADTVTTWLTEVGFTSITTSPPEPPAIHTLIAARKP